MTLACLHQTILSLRNAFLLNFWKQPYMDVRKTDRKTPLHEPILNNLNFAKNGFHHSRFRAD